MIAFGCGQGPHETCTDSGCTRVLKKKSWLLSENPSQTAASLFKKLVQEYFTVARV